MKNTQQQTRGLGNMHGSSRSSSPSLASESDATPSLSAGEQVQINLSSLDSTACADLTKQFSCQSTIKRRLSEDMKKTYPTSAGLDAVIMLVHVQFYDFKYKFLNFTVSQIAIGGTRLRNFDNTYISAWDTYPGLGRIDKCSCLPEALRQN